jgi:iron complex outermembrane receptor protein
LKRHFFQAFFAALFAAALFSGAALAQNTGKVTGKIVFSGDGKPLHGATVQITQLRKTAETGDDGVFSFDNIPAGRYTLVAHLEGFNDLVRTVTIVAGQAVTQDFELQIATLRAEVTVTASGTEQSTAEAIQSVNSVTSVQITQKASSAIGEVLDGEPGVSKRSFGPGTSRPVIRGFDGDRVLVLQDGARSGSVGYASGDHAEPIDPMGAERVEVVKGPATLLYGSSAIGGVVNVIGSDEYSQHDGARGYFTTVGGTNDRQALFSGGLEYGVKNWMFRGKAGGQRNSDFKSPLGKIPNSAGRSNTYSAGLGYYGDKGFFGGTYNYDVRRYGIPFAALFEAKKKKEGIDGGIPVIDEDIDIRMRRHNLRFNGGFRNINSFVNEMRFYVDYTDYRHKEIEIDETGDEDIATIFNNKTYGYRGIFEQKRYNKLSGRFGFEGYGRDYNVIGAEALVDGRVKHNSLAVFGLEELNFGRFKLQFGGRVENNRFRPESTNLTRRSFTGFSGGAGLYFGLWKGGAFVANYTNSYRSPSLDELYNNGPHIGNLAFEIGNSDLSRERANGIDLSLRHQKGRVRLVGDFYYYDIKDFIFLAFQDEDGDGDIDIEDGLPVARYEQENARFLGGELSVDVSINKYFSLFTSADIVKASLKADDTPLPRIPPARLRAGMEFRVKGLTVRPEGIFAASQEDLFPLETRTAGYAVFNLSASYVIAQRHFAHIFTVSGYNLNDRLYRNHLSFIKDLMPEIGRGARVGYTVRFF